MIEVTNFQTKDNCSDRINTYIFFQLLLSNQQYSLNYLSSTKKSVSSIFITFEHYFNHAPRGLGEEKE